MTRFWSLLSVMASVLLLSACGFRPVYGTLGHEDGRAGVQPAFQQIAIGSIPNREGQYLRNRLMDRLWTQGRPAATTRYQLSVSPVLERSTDLDVTKSDEATRAQLRLSTTITLTDTESQSVVLRRSLQAITSYNILASQFTTRVSAEDARRNALEDLARQIELQLSLYFDGQ